MDFCTEIDGKFKPGPILIDNSGNVILTKMENPKDALVKIYTIRL